MDINRLLYGDRLDQPSAKSLSGQQPLRDLLASLQPGQLLQAKVLSLPRMDIARLLINEVPLNARTSRPLIPGQILQLSVIKGGDNPELRIQEPGRPANGQDVLRLALPRQLPLQDSLGGLKALAPRLLPLLAGPARDALRALLDSGVPLQQLTPERLRALLRDSGLFTEARMARGQLPEASDRKALLIRLAAALPQWPAEPPLLPASAQAAAIARALDRAGLTAASQPQLDPSTRSAMVAADSARTSPAPSPATPPGGATVEQQAALERLCRLVDASVARIQTHQAASLPADDNVRPAWQTEIPLLLAGGALHTLELRIEQEAPPVEEAGSEGGWQVSIGFQFADLGPVKAGVRLLDGRIYATFWCEQPDTVRRFDAQLPRLRQTLEGAGLDVAHLAANRGEPPVATTALRPRSNLVDERA